MGDVMEIRNVVTFLRVAEMGSFTAAAAQLGYVQSTVTVQIKQLERELGMTLFDRIGKKVSLTAGGQEFVAYANQLVEVAEKAKMLGRHNLKLEGELRIGILESLFVWVLAEKLPRYYKTFPFVKIKTHTATGSELFHMLKQNELDIVFVVNKQFCDKDFVRVWAKPVKILFVTHPDNPFAHKKKVALRDLVQQPFIMTEKHGFYRKALEEKAMEQDISIIPALAVDNTSIIVKLLKKGLGVSFLPEYVVRESLDKGELAPIEVENCAVEFWEQIFYHKNKWLMPQMQGFIDLMKEPVDS